MVNKKFLGAVLCTFLATAVLPASAQASDAPQLVAQFFDIGPSPAPTTFKEIIPLKNQDPKSLPQHLFEWHPRLLLIYDSHKTRHYDARVKAIVKALGLNKTNLPAYARNDLPVYVRDVSSVAGRLQLSRDRLPARDILGPLPVMNITTGENEPLSGLHSDADVRAWIKTRMGLR